MNILNIIFFILAIYLQSIHAHELMKYQRVCDVLQAIANMVQPCIFLPKSHEFTVNYAIPHEAVLNMQLFSPINI